MPKIVRIRPTTHDPRPTTHDPRPTTHLYFYLKNKLKKYPFYKRIRSFVLFFVWNFYFIYYVVRNFFTHDVIFSKCYLGFDLCFVRPNNWGDDINKYFFEYAANVKMAVVPFSLPYFPNIEYYSLIGSMLGSSTPRKCTVYGTGIMVAQHALKIENPRIKIISVRGPKTREALIQRGIYCPPHYGDPALLLPLFYTPKNPQNNNASIVPHESTFSNYNFIVDELANKYNCTFVNMTNYDKWTDIIDKIAGSSFVMSESLHGLIVAETYKIPCLWVEFIPHESYFYFKFQDFYESIGKFGMQSVKLYEGYNFSELLKKKDEWTPGKIDYKKLLEYFPFEIKPEFKPHIEEFLKKFSPKQ